jgi:hypothetical protein
VALTQHPAAPGQGVLIQIPGRLVLTQVSQVLGEVVGGDQGVGVVFAQFPAFPGQSVLIQDFCGDQASRRGFVGLAEAAGWPGRPLRSTQVPRAYESR